MTQTKNGDIIKINLSVENNHIDEKCYFCKGNDRVKLGTYKGVGLVDIPICYGCKSSFETHKFNRYEKWIKNTPLIKLRDNIPDIYDYFESDDYGNFLTDEIQELNNMLSEIDSTINQMIEQQMNDDFQFNEFDEIEALTRIITKLEKRKKNGI